MDVLVFVTGIKVLSNKLVAVEQARRLCIPIGEFGCGIGARRGRRLAEVRGCEAIVEGPVGLAPPSAGAAGCSDAPLLPWARRAWGAGKGFLGAARSTHVSADPLAFSAPISTRCAPVRASKIAMSST